MNSHIQMPQFMLARFENVSHLLYYYDIQKRVVGNHGTAKSMNTEKDYYSAGTEQLLNKEIETPLSRLLHEIDQFDFAASQVAVPQKLNELTLNYAYSLISRSKDMPKDVMRHSIFGQFLPEKFMRNFVVARGPELARRKQLLVEFTTTYLYNRTSIPFVLPNCGMYSYAINSKHVINIPVSPNLCLIMIEKEGLVKIPAFECVEEEHIHFMNKRAFQSQINQNWGWVYSNEKKELDVLKSEYDSVVINEKA